jgi:NADH-quinone oxidoreductase subunit K
MIPLMHSLMLASALFIIGLLGVMIRRNLLFVLLSIMIMMNGAIVAFIAADHHWQQLDGQIMSLLAIITALGQACVGLALLLQFYHRRKTLNIDSLSEMKG